MALELSIAGPTRPAERFSSSWRARRGTGARERMFLTERLALLLETGHALHTAIDAVRAQVQGPLRDLLDQIREDLDAGLPFSRALARHPSAFPPTYVQVVAAAEEGGFLATALARLAAMEAWRQEMRATLSGALWYPVFLLALSLGVIVFVLAFVFPRFAEIFAGIVDQLPASTLLLMAASDVLRGWWPLLAGGTLLAGLLGRRWLRTPRGQRALERAGLRVPGLREAFVELNLIVMLRVMGLSLQNGVPVVEALASCRDVVRGQSFREALQALERAVTEGQSLSVGLRQADLLPDLARQMLATGDESGELGFVCARVADFYEREWRKRLELVSKLAEPVMLVGMGLLVGGIVSSLILPIFKLSRAVH